MRVNRFKVCAYEVRSNMTIDVEVGSKLMSKALLFRFLFCLQLLTIRPKGTLIAMRFHKELDYWTFARQPTINRLHHQINMSLVNILPPRVIITIRVLTIHNTLQPAVQIMHNHIDRHCQTTCHQRINIKSFVNEFVCRDCENSMLRNANAKEKKCKNGINCIID